MEEEMVQYYTVNADTGIEHDNQNEELHDPFDPEKISIISKIVPMETCLRRLIQGTILLNPDFQRNEVWTIEKKSLLIESLMLRIPLPMFYVSANEKGAYTTVDGLQRLSTIRSFILGDDFLESKDENKKGEGFQLKKLEFYTDYNDKKFNDLPIHIKNRILETEFNFTIINPGTPEEVKRNIFKRINTGGMPLSGQEIRNALYIGKATKLISTLSNLESFKIATGNSIKPIRMADKELILRFISFLVRDYTSYKKTINVDTFLSDTMIILNTLPSLKSRDFHKLLNRENDPIAIDDIIIKDIQQIEHSFSKAMERGYKLFDRHTFRKSYGNKPRSPINKSLFETWGVLLSRLKTKEFNSLLQNKDKLFSSYTRILDDEKFKISITRDSMKHPAVKHRFTEISNLINQNK